MKIEVVGRTRLGQPLTIYRWMRGGPKVLILGGVHGDEKEGVWAANGLIDSLMKDNLFRLELSILPTVNLDGVIAGERLNHAGVDLNRNLPTKDWTSKALKPRYQPGKEPGSEPENQALMRLIERDEPALIISLHSYKPMLNLNGECEPEARAIAAITGDELVPSIGYPTPGCLGTYTGLEMDIPTLTYEIERGMSPEDVLRIHIPALRAALEIAQKR